MMRQEKQVDINVRYWHQNRERILRTVIEAGLESFEDLKYLDPEKDFLRILKPTRARKLKAKIDESFSSAENAGKGVLNSIIDVNILASVFKNFVNCKNCDSGLELQVLKSTSGLAVSFILNCFQCEYTHEFSSSDFHEGTQIATVNARYVYALIKELKRIECFVR
ncbi:hypothetical protein AVEN_23313-1 [Araneus ventricosus]|uniref:Mutator-like transposase domain-containing protein n=1 Tax=Araneus ventricosus TaxID=182803 RepID=A0A4Y2FSN1_ARAVE|nr:hypothetical protein AVEN_23313-1 [Araneus ventricosus]